MQADSGTTTDRGRGATRGPVAVVGAGLTGASWAGLFAAAGLEVRLYDVDAGRLAGRRRARRRRRPASSPGAGSPTADAPSAASQRSPATPTSPTAVAGVTHVQECVREDLALKREVFAAVDAAAPADALICTSSSGLSISDIQTAASAARSAASPPTRTTRRTSCRSWSSRPAR